MKIYGIDTDNPVTPVMVRDAIVECFYQAHCEQTEMEEMNEEQLKNYCHELVKSSFSKANVSYDSPTKDDLLKVIGQLAEFSKSFRNPEVIKKHFEEIDTLINLIK
ncbi:MAG: hypothetical protein UR68_C0020G0006 [Candidatus Roizmanbacteria bacterium GW2011_GWA2_35_19]|uniref:Uncharacterized protein n=2 Tax=Candidatus Roizmaniibacteriota TaxID=1752723 RepID=A0A0G0C7M0_9BACT|nr:MAG: hypothetical protein UR63_C0007G0006 [Candidatus Roizmanbacteria bacterium GW2011_GWC2_35_12]KKP72151.1 MAG: hypothetical protein UR68_C0020G0006 [Candidatus Roizmanbacteria bacterium GW2011_GWA2_35_19]